MIEKNGLGIIINGDRALIKYKECIDSVHAIENYPASDFYNEVVRSIEDEYGRTFRWDCICKYQ